MEDMNVLHSIDNLLREQGYAGSTAIPKIVYLAGTTRFFRKPVSLAVFGPSGVGKSYAVESGLQFIPPSEIERLSGMSEKALVYLGSEMSLKNRILFLGEAAGMADGNGRAFLRQLISEDEINYMTVQKTAKGLIGEKLPTVEGPVCFMMTTTAHRIHHEDQSRMLTVNMDYDKETTREVMRNQAFGKSKADVQIDLTPWHDLQNELASGPNHVDISFASKLADLMPVENIKVQRDFPKVLSMIQACALVHQKWRERNEGGSIVASRADYETIYELLATPLSEGLEADVTVGVRNVVECIDFLTTERRKDYNNGISQSKLAEYLGTDRSSVVRNVHAAVGQGYLVNLTPGKGREATLQLGERKLSSTEALPHPEALFGEGGQVAAGLPSRTGAQVHKSGKRIEW